MGSTILGAHVVGVYRRCGTNFALSGKSAHQLIGSTPRSRPDYPHLEEGFHLDIWERR
jgi:hypothetical protein